MSDGLGERLPSKKKKGDGHIYCWLCLRAILNYPDSFHAIWIKGCLEPEAICVDCMPKANILIKRQFTIPEAIG